MNKAKSLTATWYGAKFRLKLDAKMTFAFRLDIPNSREYNLCRAVIDVKDTAWMKRPVDMTIVQKVLVRMSRATTDYNLFTAKIKAPYFVHQREQESDFYFLYNWKERHYELITITPKQDLLAENGELAYVYQLGLDR